MGGGNKEAFEAMALAPVKVFQGTGSVYYDEAEPAMEVQWRDLIWPQIKDFNFDVSLDFAAGHGRNAVKLAALAKQLYVADANPEAVSFLERRFSTYDQSRCSIRVIENNGEDLRDVPSDAVSFVYSFDSMVHFEQRLVEAYMPEFERVMAPGAYGFIHHSNFGRISQNPDFRRHPGWRSNVDAEFFARCCFRHKLLAVRQTLIPWFVGEVQVHDFDCLTIIYKPLSWLGESQAAPESSSSPLFN